LTIAFPDADAIIVPDLVYNRAHLFLGERRFDRWRPAAWLSCVALISDAQKSA
jgi:hypothetical protein